MADSKFVYVTYIRTTPESLWEALTTPEFTRRYCNGAWQESTWEPGAPWKIVFPDGSVGDTGEVIEVEKPWRIVLRWRNEFMPEMKAEGYSRCTYEIEAIETYVKLTITHEMDKPNSKFIGAVTDGWPKILSSLKSLLETGEPLSAIASPKDTSTGTCQSRL